MWGVIIKLQALPYLPLLCSSSLIYMCFAAGAIATGPPQEQKTVRFNAVAVDLDMNPSIVELTKSFNRTGEIL